MNSHRAELLSAKVFASCMPSSLKQSRSWSMLYGSVASPPIMVGQIHTLPLLWKWVLTWHKIPPLGLPPLTRIVNNSKQTFSASLVNTAQVPPSSCDGNQEREGGGGEGNIVQEIQKNVEVLLTIWGGGRGPLPLGEAIAWALTATAQPRPSPNSLMTVVYSCQRGFRADSFSLASTSFSSALTQRQTMSMSSPMTFNLSWPVC